MVWEHSLGVCPGVESTRLTVYRRLVHTQNSSAGSQVDGLPPLGAHTKVECWDHRLVVYGLPFVFACKCLPPACESN